VQLLDELQRDGPAKVVVALPATVANVENVKTPQRIFRVRNVVEEDLHAMLIEAPPPMPASRPRELAVERDELVVALLQQIDRSVRGLVPVVGEHGASRHRRRRRRRDGHGALLAAVKKEGPDGACVEKHVSQNGYGFNT